MGPARIQKAETVISKLDSGESVKKTCIRKYSDVDEASVIGNLGGYRWGDAIYRKKISINQCTHQDVRSKHLTDVNWGF